MSNDAENRTASPSAPTDLLPNAEPWSAMALALQPVAPVADVRAKLIARLAGPERFMLFASDLARVFGVTQEAARAALLRIDEPGIWQDGFAPGSRVFSTPELQAVDTVVARVPAAMRILRHPHASRELTLVLHGSLIEDDHTEHGPGAVLDMPANTEHSIAVAPDAECWVVFSPMRL